MLAPAFIRPNSAPIVVHPGDGAVGRVGGAEQAAHGAPPCPRPRPRAGWPHSLALCGAAHSKPRRLVSLKTKLTFLRGHASSSSIWKKLSRRQSTQNGPCFLFLSIPSAMPSRETGQPCRQHAPPVRAQATLLRAVKHMCNRALAGALGTWVPPPKPPRPSAKR